MELNPGARVRLRSSPSSTGVVDGWIGPSHVRVAWDAGHRGEVIASSLELCPSEAVAKPYVIVDREGADHASFATYEQAERNLRTHKGERVEHRPNEALSDERLNDLVRRERNNFAAPPASAAEERAMAEEILSSRGLYTAGWNAALQEAAKAARGHEEWANDPGRLSEVERRLIVGASQVIAREIESLARQRPEPARPDVVNELRDLQDLVERLGKTAEHQLHGGRSTVDTTELINLLAFVTMPSAIVPAWVVEMLVKVLQKGERTT